MEKSWYKSSTLWLNAGLAAVAAVLQALSVSVPTEYAVFVTAALNMIQRFRTTSALTR